MKNIFEDEGRLASLRQEWKERLESGETIPKILKEIENPTERKLATVLFIELLRENPLFKDDEFFIGPDGKKLIFSLTGDKLSQEQKETLEKLGFETVAKFSENIPESMVSFFPIKPEKKAPSPIRFEEAKKLPYVPIDWDFFEIVPYVIPHRITENNLAHKQILKDNSLALRYEIESRGKRIIFNFLIPPEVIGRTKERDIPTVGISIRKALYAALSFAFVQNTSSPNFKRSHLLQLMGEDTQKIGGKLYADLDKGLLTWAYGTYTIISENKVSEVGHIVNKVKLARKRGDKIVVDFNPEVVNPLFRSQVDDESRRYIAYPVPLLKAKGMKLYVRNFCESLLKKKGMGRKVYPKYVKNILIQDFGIPPKKLRKFSNQQIHDIFIEGVEAATHNGLLESYTATAESQKKAPFNIRKWKMKLIVVSRPSE